MRCRICQHEIPDAGPCPTCAASRGKGRLAGAVLLQRGEGPGEAHALRLGRNKLGRDPSCDIVLNDVRASGDHAYLFIGADGAVQVTDISRNGTLVDGRPIQGASAPVRHGSVLQVGAVQLMVLLAPAVGT